MNKQQHQNNPYSDRYDDPRYGCGFCVGLAVLLLAFLVFAFTGCKTVQVGQSHDRDSVRVEYRVDSFTHVIRDSVRIQLPCNDSIEVAYVDRWRTNTIYRYTALRDTIRVCSTDTIYQPYEVPVIKTQNSKFATFCIWNSVIIWVIIAITLSLLIYRRTIRPK